MKYMENENNFHSGQIITSFAQGMGTFKQWPTRDGACPWRALYRGGFWPILLKTFVFTIEEKSTPPQANKTLFNTRGFRFHS